MPNFFVRLTAIAAALFTSHAAYAGWNSTQETIAGKKTWLYVPDEPVSANTRILNGRRALVIMLHGCAQSATDFKNFGNWDPTAKEYGLVVAIPDVGNGVVAGCWDYDKAQDSHGHVRAIIDLATELKSRSQLDIDPNQVYVAGLSSGAALALEIACTAPDVFAGVGAIEGPSVGSDQSGAVNPPPANNVDKALAKCKSVAGVKTNSFPTQIASVGYGDLDKHDGGTCPFFPPRPAGEKCFVPIEWTEDNAKVFSRLYSCSFGGPGRTSDQKAQEQLCKSQDGKVRASLLKMLNIGHAWPAGSGDTGSGGGDYINKLQFNYPAYVTAWLFANNLRVSVPPAVSISSTAVHGISVEVKGSAQGSGPDDPVTEVFVKLDGQVPQGPQKATGTNSFSAVFDNVSNDACYTAIATATDKRGATATASGDIVKVGNPAANQPPNVAGEAKEGERSCINVTGTALAFCARIKSVEVEIGDRGFEQAELREQGFAYGECGLASGTYAVKVKATDDKRHAATVALNAVTIKAPIAENGSWLDHMNANRIRNYAEPCPSVGFGTCDAGFQTIFLQNQFNPFNLYRAAKSEDWYLDSSNVPSEGAQPEALDTLIDINSATAAQLSKLPKIGKQRGQAIVKNRPYSSIQDLVNKNVVPRNVFEAVKDQIVAR